jgi:hypothetical protein
VMADGEDFRRDTFAFLETGILRVALQIDCDVEVEVKERRIGDVLFESEILSGVCQHRPHALSQTACYQIYRYNGNVLISVALLPIKSTFIGI